MHDFSNYTNDVSLAGNRDFRLINKENRGLCHRMHLLVPMDGEDPDDYWVPILPKRFLHFKNDGGLSAIISDYSKVFKSTEN